MLGSALPATATLQTSTSSATPSSPTRSSRLRGLSYLRNLHSSSTRDNTRDNTPSLPRSRSSNTLGGSTDTRREVSSRRSRRQQETQGEEIQGNEHGWLPTVQGRSGLSRDYSLHPTSTTDSASPERSTSGAGMSRNRASTAASGPTAASESRSATLRRPSHTGDIPTIDSTMANNSTNTLSQGATSGQVPEMPTIRFIPHIDRSNQRPSLQFAAVSRTLAAPNSVVRVGRYSERDQAPPPLWDKSVSPVGFKSKVVSRKHCEFWHSNGQWYVKDVKSSSGTFLNHVRLSGPGTESRPYPVSDGDVIQLGIDFKGGEEVIFRCVKIRIECNRGWQKSLNSFNTTAHERLLNRSKNPDKNSNAAGKTQDSDAQSTSGSECSICLNPVAPCQALFVAPCSHVWHFKCIRNLINGPNYPNFLCPNCRFSADLEADVEPPEDFAAFEFEDGVEETGDTDMMDDDDRGDSGGVDVSDASEEESDARGAGQRNNGIESEMENGTENAQPAQPRQQQVRRSLNGREEARLRPGANASKQSHSIDVPSPRIEASSSDVTGARATTPTSNTLFALTAGNLDMDPSGRVNERDGNREDTFPGGTEGPLTPRNDAGPFVMDGAAEQARVNAVDASRALQQDVA